MDPKLFKVKLDELAHTKVVDSTLKVEKLKPQHYECPYGGPGNCKIESKLSGTQTTHYKKHWRHRCKTCYHYVIDNEWRMDGDLNEITAFFKQRAEKLAK